jgi:predicted RNA-binding Zn-ribbon protein involved in translation (DUF1610 family)
MTFTMTEDEFRRGDDEFEGRCLSCGTEAYGVEPDARRYECEACGESKVYGLAELLMMGCIGFGDEDDSGSS